MRLPLLLVVASLLTVAVQPIAAQNAQSLAELQPGAKIRIEAPGVVARHYVGTVLARNAETITMGSANSLPVTIPIAAVTRLEISRGKSRSAGALRGILWGAPIGLVAALITPAEGFNSPYGPTSQNEWSKAELVGAGAIGGALWGAGIGALVGRERWDQFQLASRTTLNVHPQGVTVGLRLPLP